MRLATRCYSCFMHYVLVIGRGILLHLESLSLNERGSPLRVVSRRYAVSRQLRLSQRSPFRCQVRRLQPQRILSTTILFNLVSFPPVTQSPGSWGQVTDSLRLVAGSSGWVVTDSLSSVADSLGSVPDSFDSGEEDFFRASSSAPGSTMEAGRCYR